MTEKLPKDVLDSDNVKHGKEKVAADGRERRKPPLFMPHPEHPRLQLYPLGTLSRARPKLVENSSSSTSFVSGLTDSLSLSRVKRTVGRQTESKEGTCKVKSVTEQFLLVQNPAVRRGQNSTNARMCLFHI
jgi:hypothetical protein